ncbi:MAG: hypothetical protein JW855_05280 [Gammaproteobacteria bacterium]|nr:hypothetical protein [Gammaproteobacteria bacterium]
MAKRFFLILCFLVSALVTISSVYAENDDMEAYDPVDQLTKIFSKPYQPDRSDFVPGDPGYYRIYEYFLVVKDYTSGEKEEVYAHIDGKVYCSNGNDCQPRPVKKGWIVPSIRLSVISGTLTEATCAIGNSDLFRGPDGSDQITFEFLDDK